MLNGVMIASRTKLSKPVPDELCMEFVADCQSEETEHSARFQPLCAIGSVVAVRYSWNTSFNGRAVKKQERYRRHFLSLAGIVVSILLAFILIISVRGTHRSLLVPVVFLVFIILCARYFGMLAGVVASIIASALFAIFLYEPYGTFQIKDHQALWNLALLLFAGIALSYANSGGEDEPKAPKNS